MKSRIRLSAIQLRAIRDRLGVQAAPRWILISLLPSIVLGVWTLWIYITVGRIQQQLATEQLRLSVNEAKEAKVKIAYGLHVQPVAARPGMYDGKFEITVTNESRRRVEISWVVYELYTGQLRQPLDDDSVLVINNPPKKEIGIDESTSGAVVWQHKASRGFLYPSSHV